MKPLSTRTKAVLAAIAVVPLVLLSSTAASAYNRTSGNSFAMSGDDATWTITSAWHPENVSAIRSSTVGDTVDITQIAAYSDPVGGGVDTGLDLTVTSYTGDYSNPLYSQATEVLEGDLSTLGDGIYEVYVTGFPQNWVANNTGEQTWAQWVRFTKTAGVYNLAPNVTTPLIYSAINTSGMTTVDLSSTDPEGGTEFHSLNTSTVDPNYGFTELPCSTFVAGVLSVDASLCTGGDVFADIFVPNSFWGVRVDSSDLQGNLSTTMGMLYVSGPPLVRFDGYEFGSDPTEYSFYFFNDSPIPVDSWTITCTNEANPSDVITDTTPYPGTTIGGFTIGARYNCYLAGTSATGTDVTPMPYLVVAGQSIWLNPGFAIGDTLAGSTVQASGDTLVPSSAWDVIQGPAPLLIGSGVTDLSGYFSQVLTFTSAACVAGPHQLTATGQSVHGFTTTYLLAYELDNNCEVLSLDWDVAALGQLATTGADVQPWMPITAVVAVLGGVALVLFTGRRRRAARAVR